MREEKKYGLARGGDVVEGDPFAIAKLCKIIGDLTWNDVVVKVDLQRARHARSGLAKGYVSRGREGKVHWRLERRVRKGQ